MVPERRVGWIRCNVRGRWSCPERSIIQKWTSGGSAGSGLGQSQGIQSGGLVPFLVLGALVWRVAKEKKQNSFYHFQVHV